jgi:hypothetical protein
MGRFLLALATGAVTAGCWLPQRPALEAYTSERHGFTISRPAPWQHVESENGERIWFLPERQASGEAPEASATEFIVVMTIEVPGPLPEYEVRRLAMTLLPMHGVSGFQRTPASTDAVAWYAFELTGSTRGTEWASLGLLVTGPRRMHYVVCAGPLPVWRDRQKLCDEVVRSFRPGDLTR